MMTRTDFLGSVAIGLFIGLVVIYAIYRAGLS